MLTCPSVRRSTECAVPRWTRSGDPTADDLDAVEAALSESGCIRPDLLRRVVLASSAPQGYRDARPGTGGDRGGRTSETSPQGYLDVFFAATGTSREAGQQAAGRIFGGRTTDRDEPTTW